jgi:CheY-like chemotaxis protein/HPt (histidine-containing phosphotransfer) domain-containing protein
MEVVCQVAGNATSVQAGEFDAAIVDTRLDADSHLAKGLLIAQVPTIIVTPVGDKAADHWWGLLRQKRTLAPLKNVALKVTLEELLVPRSQPAALPVPPQSTAPSKATLAARLPLKILVTDDNVINQKVAVRLLQQFGYAADIASNGIEAVAAVEANAYDMVFMDMQMPRMDGLEATRRIREMERTTSRRPMTVIAMTANAMMGDRERCLVAGMDDYLAKPVRPEALQVAVEKWGARYGSQNSTSTAHIEPASVQPKVAEVVSTAPSAEQAPTPDEIAEMIDLDRLTEFAGGSRTSLIEITDLYINQTTEQLDGIRGAIEQNDAATVARLAHSAAGASGVCGILVMESLFRRAEQLGKESRVLETIDVHKKMRAQFERVKVCLLNSRQNMPLS